MSAKSGRLRERAPGLVEPAPALRKAVGGLIAIVEVEKPQETGRPSPVEDDPSRDDGAELDRDTSIQRAPGLRAEQPPGSGVRTIDQRPREPFLCPRSIRTAG